jgi:hypothetical protein
MSRRSVAANCVEILRALLPDDDRELKSAARSLSELASAAHESKDSARFSQAIRCLESDLRVISQVTTNEASEQLYSLSHDYLVRPIQSWLAAQDNSTWQGRARQRLTLMAGRYARKSSRDNLLGVWDWFVATIAVSKSRRSTEQSRVLRASRTRAMAWLSVFAVGITLIAFLGVSVRTESIRAFENQRIAVNNDIYSFLNTKSSELETLFPRLQNNLRIAKKEIEGLLPVENPNQKRRQILLKGLLGAKVAMEDIDESVSKSDLGELDLWKTYLNNKSHRDVVVDYLQDKNHSNSFAEWQWLFLVLQDYRLLQHILDADDPAVKAYEVLAFAAQDEPPFLNPDVRASVARNLIESGKTEDITFHTKMNLATHIIGLDAFQKNLVPEALLDYLESTKTDTKRSKAMTAQWFLSNLEGSRIIAPPTEPSEEWRIDEPIQGLPFAMIRIPEGELTYEINGAKGKKEIEMMMDDNIWMASEEVSSGMVDAFFREFPMLRDADWVSDVSNDLGASNIEAPTVLKFCNWLSAKAGLEQVYAFGAGQSEIVPIANFSEIYIDVTADGYRLPTLDEFRYASIHGNYESFWTKVATKEMMRRFDPKSNGPNPTFANYPNAWGFLGLRGNLWEMVVDNQFNLSVSLSGEGVQLWNVPIPFDTISDSKKRTNGFRLVQGAIEYQAIKRTKK